MNLTLHWPETRVGRLRDGRPIEWSSQMTALVYFGRRNFQTIDNRPIVCTDQDIIARVERVYRCGTDVKVYDNGRPDQVEESLLEELQIIFDCAQAPGDLPFNAYAALVLEDRFDSAIHDPLYCAIAQRISSLSTLERQCLPDFMRRHWGRLIGHETVVKIERVGSRVKRLKQGIGYLDGLELTEEQVAFEPGQLCVLQSRIARYDPPVVKGPDVRGVQLLNQDIASMSMNLDGAYATHVRLTLEMICSGSILRIPAGIPVETAGLCEPTACLLDCFQKTTHEVGQDHTGSILLKGVRMDGLTCIIGSGTMALMSVMMALMDDPIIKMGRAREVMMIVRSQSKKDFVLRLMQDYPIHVVICPTDEELPTAVRQQYAEEYSLRTGKPFNGFDDVILAAGDANTIAPAHALLAPTGARLMAFAGTRGPCSIESGLWHYANAGVTGSSGSNTRMLEIALGLLSRGSLDPRRLAGKAYTFSDLASPQGVEAFFHDKYLRPYLVPNMQE